MRKIQPLSEQPTLGYSRQLRIALRISMVGSSKLTSQTTRRIWPLSKQHQSSRSRLIPDQKGGKSTSVKTILKDYYLQKLATEKLWITVLYLQADRIKVLLITSWPQKGVLLKWKNQQQFYSCEEMRSWIRCDRDSVDKTHPGRSSARQFLKT